MALFSWGFSAFRITIQLQWLVRFMRALVMRMIEQNSSVQGFDKENKLFHVFVYTFYCTRYSFFMEKTTSVRAVQSALARISNKWSKFKDLLHPLTSNGLPLETKVDHSLLACILLFYFRVKRSLLKKKIWSN